MPGRWITNKQVEIYTMTRKQHTQKLSAVKAGISERTARKIDSGHRLPPQANERHWKTRKDPFEEVWDELASMLYQEPGLQPLTLLEYLQDRYPGQYPDTKLRTLQRRIKQWRAINGPSKEVMFEQAHPIGQQGLSDFTTLKDTTIMIKGEHFSHLLYHFRLAYSRWSYMRVVRGRESYAALAQGLSEALHRLGGSPQEHRTDSLSAAYKNLSKEAQEDITHRYRMLCEHFSMKATRNNPGASHENGSIESPHGHLKRRIKQALMLRGSCHFESIDAYQLFIESVVRGHNNRNATSIAIEKEALQPLPTGKPVDYSEYTAVVSSAALIQVRCVSYSVDSRLCGETLRVRLYDECLVCYLGTEKVATMERVYPPKGKRRAKSIDYRHVIDSLIKKPAAFRYSRLRDDMLPNEVYRKVWRHIDSCLPGKQVCKLMVGLLHLAAKESCEADLGEAVLAIISAGKTIHLNKLQDQFRKRPICFPALQVSQHTLAAYDALLQQHNSVQMRGYHV